MNLFENVSFDLKQVEVTVRSMNKGDCFILDTPTLIYVYVGRYSKRTERLKAVQAATLLRDQDHGGRVKINIIGMGIKVHPDVHVQF